MESSPSSVKLPSTEVARDAAFERSIRRMIWKAGSTDSSGGTSSAILLDGLRRDYQWLRLALVPAESDLHAAIRCDNDSDRIRT